MAETPRQAARRLSMHAIKDNFKPEALHEYRDAIDNILFYRVRLKHPNGKKWIRPMYLNGHGYEIGEPEFPHGKTLYQLPQLIARPADPVWFVEGEWNAEHLTRLGVLSTTSGGSTSAKPADFSPLANRQIVLWPDNDAPGLRHAQEVAERLIELGATVRLVDIAKLSLPDKGDCVDWLKGHPTATASDLDKLPLVDYPKAKSASVEGKAEAPRKSQATRLIELVETVELFHDADGKGYATLEVSGHKETWPIRSKGFRDWLCHQFYLAERRAPTSSSLQDALMTIDGRARYDGAKRPVFRRVAEYESRVYIDLCDVQWRAVEITTDGWKVTPQPPVRFIRVPGMHALPEPFTHLRIAALWNNLNVSDRDRCLVLAWLVAAMRPTGPYPVLILQGEQGTAKSAAAKVLRSLVDPSGVPLRTAPRDERDLMIAARNGWVIALDNLSGLSPWLSDALCRIATGGGFATRELYSDTDEILIDVQRPIILNGIDDIATRQDLIDRSIIINLEPIPDNKRKPEAEFWRAFDEDKTEILGALLDGVSRALRQLPTTYLDTLPRMADFALWASAAESKDQEGEFIKAYLGNRQSAIESGLEGSPVATALREEINPDSPFDGTATELLNTLNARVDDRTRLSRSWPKSAKALSSQLRRLATALRTVGIEVQFKTESGSGARRLIHIKPIRKDAQSSVAPSDKSLKLRGISCDAKATQTHDCDPSCDANAKARRNGDANERKLTHCSKIKCGASDAGDAKLHAFSKTYRPQWTTPTFEIIPNAPEGVPWYEQYPPNSTTIDGGPWSTRI